MEEQVKLSQNERRQKEIDLRRLLDVNNSLEKRMLTQR